MVHSAFWVVLKLAKVWKFECLEEAMKLADIIEESRDKA